jgi:hypothetical protein
MTVESCAAANGAIDLLSNQRNATEGLQVFKADIGDNLPNLQAV